MTIFYFFAAALLVLALLWILRPLLRKQVSAAPPREAANLSILKDQLAELDADRSAGLLSDSDYAQARTELERRVLDEALPSPAAAPQTSGKALAITIASLVCLGSVGLYALLGSPDALVAETRATPDLSSQNIDDMISRLAQHMAEHPEDAKGWGILARSYYTLGRYAEAVSAFEQLVKVSPPSAEVLADYADALAMAQGGDLSGRPVALLHKALQLDAGHGKTMLLLGSDAFAREDYRAALKYWEPLLAELPPEAEFTQRLAAGVEEARARSGQSAPKTTLARADQSISGTVSVAPALLAQVDPEDTVFVFARAAKGPKMPLAVLRLKAKELPTAFKLDDTNAMRPDALLSQQTAVVVGARLSKSGNPLPQAGDLEGYSGVLQPNAQNLQLVIEHRIP